MQYMTEKTFGNRLRTATVKTIYLQCYILSKIRTGCITALRLGDTESPNYGLPNIAISGGEGEGGKKQIINWLGAALVDIKYFKL